MEKSEVKSGVLTEFGKKRNTDHVFPLPFTWAEINKSFLIQIK